MPLRIPIPAVLFGRKTSVGRPVSDFLQPGYEVIHFIASPEAAHTELPLLLAGRDPQAKQPNDIGTHVYDISPRVLVFGRGYSPDFVEELRKAYGRNTRDPLAWVAGDPATAPTLPLPPGYPELVARDVKAALASWKDEGGVKDAFILY
ncbi:hypothetical protein BJX70DRAFT_380206 [Aspergillus crustosus]